MPDSSDKQPPGFPPREVLDEAFMQVVELAKHGRYTPFTLDFVHAHIGDGLTGRNVVFVVVGALQEPGIFQYMASPFDVESAREMATAILGACVCPEDVEKVGH